MFRRHRDDLLAAQENERRAKDQVITVLADQVEWLRWQLNDKAHMSPALHELHTQERPQFPTPEDIPGFDPDFKPYLSEEEEELLALNLNQHISDAELAALREEIGKVIPFPNLEPDA